MVAVRGLELRGFKVSEKWGYSYSFGRITGSFALPKIKSSNAYTMDQLITS